MKAQKLGLIRVSREWLGEVLSGKVNGPVVETDAPNDIRVLDMFTDHSHFFGEVVLKCESESFIPVDEGHVIPYYGPYHYKVKAS